MTIPSLDNLARAAAQILEDAPDKASADATNKALWHLGRGLDVIETHGAFLIPSGTRGGMVHRVSLTHGCSCEASAAGRPCWHYAAVVLIEWARESHPTPTYDEALAAIEELFA